MSTEALTKRAVGGGLIPAPADSERKSPLSEIQSHAQLLFGGFAATLGVKCSAPLIEQPVTQAINGQRSLLCDGFS